MATTVAATVKGGGRGRRECEQHEAAVLVGQQINVGDNDEIRVQFMEVR
jgi:hypothetical protein